MALKLCKCLFLIVSLCGLILETIVSISQDIDLMTQLIFTTKQIEVVITHERKKCRIGDKKTWQQQPTTNHNIACLMSTNWRSTSLGLYMLMIKNKDSIYDQVTIKRRLKDYVICLACLIFCKWKCFLRLPSEFMVSNGLRQNEQKLN